MEHNGIQPILVEQFEIMKNDDTLRLRLGGGLKKDLQKLADQDKRKLSDYIRIQLEKIVEISKKKGK